MRKLFGTDGIRGVANIDPMTTEMAMQLGRGVAYIFKNKDKRHRIVIGKDTRLSGYMLENALVAGICSMGVDVLLVGPLPTPGIAFLTSSMRADAGIVISASHNPFQDNGIKIFSGNGFKLPDQLENKIEELIFSDQIDSLRPTAAEVGKAFRVDDAVGRYVVYLKNSYPKEFSLDGMKIVLDCANGAAYRVAPAVFEELGAEVIAWNIEPNGENINWQCGSLYPKLIMQKVKDCGADIGISLDGDADRAIFSDELGNLVDGDRIMAICANSLHQGKRLRRNTLVATVMSNLGLDLAMKERGIKVLHTQVGDRYVVEEMARGGYNLGGEQSGHLIFLDYNTTGDGVLSALQVLAVMKRENKRLSELAKIMTPFPQVLLNVPVRQKKDPQRIPEIASLLKKIEAKLADRGRILVRSSGTESLIRVMVEGENEKEISAFAEQIAECIRKKMVD
ncbi:MAG: phosphoglucosamine mutase [Deltaproteobacteria bacterium]|nr:phosphoglucosamine mutase [Deltaproteobacteria bacterium]